MLKDVNRPSPQIEARERILQLEWACEEVIAAALKQLSGIGKGREPSERLRDAITQARKLIAANRA